jgi:hypothetical protein
VPRLNLAQSAVAEASVGVGRHLGRQLQVLFVCLKLPSDRPFACVPARLDH